MTRSYSRNSERRPGDWTFLNSNFVQDCFHPSPLSILCLKLYVPAKNETVWAYALFHRATFLQRRSSELMDNEELQVWVLYNKRWSLWNKMTLLDLL